MRYDGMVVQFDGQSQQRRRDGLLIRGCAPCDVAAVAVELELERERLRA